MAKRAFYSFHYQPDNWRAATVRSIGAIEGNQCATDNDWETIAKGGDAAIKRWIDNQLNGKSIVIVLIGANTYGRKWINYEIETGWNAGKALLGIHIHGLKDRSGMTANKGANPFAYFNINGKSFDQFVTTYDPPGYTSKEVYANIAAAMPSLIQTAIEARNA